MRANQSHTTHWTFILAMFVLLNTAFGVPPIAETTGPYDALVNESLELDGSMSFDPDGDPIIRMLWLFGDGSFYEESEIDAPDGDFDGRTIYPYSAVGLYFGMLEVEDLSGEIGFNFFVVGIEPDSDKLDFLAKGLELAILLDSVVLPDGIRNSLDQKLAKIIEDVDESERYDTALNRIKALLNEVQAQADQFEEQVLADALELIRTMSLTGSTILNPQVKNVTQATPATEWQSFEITVPVGINPYDVHIIFDVMPVDADVALKGWTASVNKFEARYKTDSRPLSEGSKYRGGKFSAKVATGAKVTGFYFTDSAGKKIK